jgi:hypothetical protein
MLYHKLGKLEFRGNYFLEAPIVGATLDAKHLGAHTKKLPLHDYACALLTKKWHALRKSLVYKDAEVMTLTATRYV